MLRHQDGWQTNMGYSPEDRKHCECSFLGEEVVDRLGGLGEANDLARDVRFQA